MQDTSGNDKLKTVYSILYSHFGPQGWWPVYSDGGRGYHKGDFSLPSTEKQRLEIAFGAILTQQASWKNAEKAIFNLMERNMLSAQAIMDAPEDELQRFIRSSGYFRQKAARLKGFSRFLLERYGGSMGALLAGGPDRVRKELLSINGIGRETADSIMLYAGNIPVFVVDAYTFRMAERTGIHLDRDYEELKSIFESSVERDFRTYNEYHALIVELGKMHCRPRPLCQGCPLRDICAYHKKL